MNKVLTQEKKDQVGMADEIYKKASATMVWLNSGTSMIHNSFESVRRLANYLVDNDLSAVSVLSFPRDKKELLTVRAITDPVKFGLNPPEHTPLIPVLAPFSHPWWRRV